MKKVEYISLVTESLFEVKEKYRKDVVQVINSDSSVIYELDMTRAFFTNPVMGKVAEIEDVLLQDEISHIRYWFEDGSMKLVALDDENEQSRFKQQQKIYININTDTTKLLEV